MPCPYWLFHNDAEEFFLPNAHVICSGLLGVEFGSWVGDNSAINLQSAMFNNAFSLGDGLSFI